MGGDWIARDAAHVWHGFTQMSSYADNAPIIVERAEGHELIDVDGRRYLDAISSLWVNTLGHRVPELDDAVREQLDRGATPPCCCNSSNRVVIELAEALAARVPVDDPHFLYASDGASGRGAGAEDRVPVLGEPRRSRTRSRSSPSAARTTATPSAPFSVRRRHRRFPAPASSIHSVPRCCAPGILTIRIRFEHAARMVAATRRSSPR